MNAETATTPVIAAPAESSTPTVSRGEQRETIGGLTVRVRACDRCEGRGTRLDAVDAGELVRAERRALNLRTAQFAARCKLSAAYLIDLEMGRRAWTRDLFSRVIAALAAVRAEQEAAQ